MRELGYTSLSVYLRPAAKKVLADAAKMSGQTLTQLVTESALTASLVILGKKRS